MKRILTAVLMLATLMILCVGCGKGKDVSGTYKLDSMAGMSVADLQKQYDELGISMNVADMITVEIKSDDTFTMKMDSESYSGTYKLDGDNISLTVDGDTQKGTLKDGTLTIGEGNEQMVFKKK
ncbi:MAG: DUF4923 family protein [Lachnospiraceae bacterium]|nr:DUF4923 family protein [Lachnospiraceae bacterium]